MKRWFLNPILDNRLYVKVGGEMLTDFQVAHFETVFCRAFSGIVLLYLIYRLSISLSPNEPIFILTMQKPSRYSRL